MTEATPTAEESTRALFKSVLTEHANENGNKLLTQAKQHPVLAGLVLLVLLGFAPGWVQDIARSVITGKATVESAEVKTTVEAGTTELRETFEAETKRADVAHQLLDDKIKVDSGARMIEDAYQTNLLEGIAQANGAPSPEFSADKKDVEKARAAAKKKLAEPLPPPLEK